MPDTGSWQHWVTLRRTVTLPGGPQALRVVFDATGPNDGIANLNWVAVQPVSSSVEPVLQLGILR